MNGGEENITLVTPQFIGVGATDGSVDLNSISCVEDGLDLIYLNTLYPDGSLCDTYYWSTVGDKNCWTDWRGKAVTGVTFVPGTGLWIQSDMEDVVDNAFISAGQVGTDDVTTELNGGDENITLVGNSSPVEIDLNDILCCEDGLDLIYLNTLYPDGSLCDTYYWSTVGDKNCWTDWRGKAVTGVTFAPGTGLWIQSDMEDVGTITFPGVEL